MNERVNGKGLMKAMNERVTKGVTESVAKKYLMEMSYERIKWTD